MTVQVRFFDHGKTLLLNSLGRFVLHVAQGIFSNLLRRANTFQSEASLLCGASKLLQRSSCLELIQNRKSVKRQGSGALDATIFDPLGRKICLYSELQQNAESAVSLRLPFSRGLSQKCILLEFLTPKFFGLKGRRSLRPAPLSLIDLRFWFEAVRSTPFRF